MKRETINMQINIDYSVIRMMLCQTDIMHNHS